MNSSLAGLRIVVTRAHDQALDMAARVRERGGTPVVLPCLEVTPIRSSENLTALPSIDEFDWWVFTSANAVNMFFQQLAKTTSADPGRFAATNIAVVGERTRETLAGYEVEPSLVASPANAAALVRQLADIGIAGKRILVPCSRIARPTLLEGLEQAGALVTALPVYDVVAPDSVPLVEARAVRGGAAEIVTFASPSAVRNFICLVGEAPLQRVTIAAIGATTAAELESVGLPPAIVPTRASIDSLLAAIADYFAREARRRQPDDER